MEIVEIVLIRQLLPVSLFSMMVRVRMVWMVVAVWILLAHVTVLRLILLAEMTVLRLVLVWIH